MSAEQPKNRGELEPVIESPPLNIWCVIPVYNCAEPAIRVARACRRHLERVLVVDDGSTDADLRARLDGTDIVVVRHDRNRGKGHALVTALQYLADHNGTHMITVDGDGQHLPEDIPKLMAAIREDQEAIVIGCRDFDTLNVPRSSRFGRKFSNFWIHLETGLALNDTQSGFRAYPLRLLSRLRLVSAHYDFEIEVLVRAVWAGARVTEVPVSVVYPPPLERISHFRPFLDNARLSRMHARLVGRRLLPWPHKRLVERSDHVVTSELLRHPVRNLKRLLSENATPAGLAAAAAVSSLLAVLPLIGFHMVVIYYACSRLHLNRVMALAIQNLYMAPFTPFLCIQIGFYMRHGRWWTEFNKEMLLYNFHHRLLEWLLGSLILAPIYAVIAGTVTYLAARQLQRHLRSFKDG